MKKTVFIALLLMCFGRTIPAQNYRFDHFTTQNGLCYNVVRDMVRDSLGFIWIATSNGISRFDGFEFRNYTQNGLRSPWVTNLLVDKNGVLWVATEGGVCFYNPLIDAFEYVDDESNDIQIVVNAALCLGKKDDLWVAAENGLKKINTRQKTVENTPIDRILGANALFYDADNILWIGCNEGLIAFDPLSKKVQRFRLKSGRWTYFIQAIFPENERQLWLATDAGLMLFDKKTGHSTVFTKASRHQKNVVVTDIAVFDDSNNRLWCATRNNGVLFFDRQKRQFSGQLATDLAQPTGLNTNEINCFFNDGSRFWLGTDNGLNVINANKLQFAVTPITEMYDNKTLDLLSNVTPDPKNPRFWWIASRNDNGCLMLFDSQKKRVEKTYYLSALHPDLAEPNNQIRAVTFDADGTLWVASLNGLFAKKGADWTHVPLSAQGLDAYVIQKDKKGCFWVGTETGLVRFDPRNRQVERHDLTFKGTPEQENSDYRPFPIETILIENDSLIRLTCIKYGFFSYHLPSKRLVHHGVEIKGDFFTLNRINPFAKDSAGDFWLGASAGLLHFSPSSGQFTLYAPSQPFYVYDVMADKSRNLWLSTHVGIHCFNPQNKQFTTFGQNEGLSQSFILSRFSVLDTTFLLPFKGGYVAFKPDKIPDFHRNLPAFITQITANGRFLSQNTEGVTRLRHTENTLQFNFSSLDFDNPEKASFRYRLEGFDENWVQADARRQANYTNLDAGNYVFTVQVANANGDWLSSRSFKFKIVPPFYLTFWFLALVGVAILGLVYAFYQYRVGQILKVQEMRNRIAADLHDEVGSTLSSISILSELAVFQRNESHQLMEQISENARDMIDKMDDIVWAINPDNDLLFDLESRVKTFAVPLFESKNIDFSIQFGEATQNIKLNLVQRRNVFLILKEAINNLVKYSQARKAAVICTRLNNQLIFNVKDDGIGFDLTAPTDRNGLKNMRQRAERIGGHLTIESAVGQGTSVTAQLKI